MCITKKEVENRINEIRSLKTLKEETEATIRALEQEVIQFLSETEECKSTDKKGKEVFQYIGSDFKATYSEQARETLDKEAIKNLLSEADFNSIRKEIFFKVLRIR